MPLTELFRLGRHFQHRRDRHSCAFNPADGQIDGRSELMQPPRGSDTRNQFPVTEHLVYPEPRRQ